MADRRGDDRDAELLQALYDDLHRVARGYMRGERRNHTLQPTALVNEAWLRLSRQKSGSGPDRQGFFNAMVAYMRRHLVDHARRRNAEKRGGGIASVEIDESIAALDSPAPDEAESQLEQLDRALQLLQEAHPRARRVVELRLFAGQSVEQAAATLSVATGTVKRDFAFARSFLKAELERNTTPSAGGAGE